MPSRPPLLRRRNKVFYGWWIVISYFFLNFYWGGTLILGFSPLFTPIREAFGLSNTATTVAISLRHATAAIGSPAVGYIFDRSGPRLLMIGATASSALGLLLLVVGPRSAWLFFLALAITSIGVAIWIAGTGPAAMALWFTRHRGKAIGIILAGTGFGAIIVPALVWVIEQWGWKAAIGAIIIGLIAVSLPASLLLRHKPQKYGLLPDGEVAPSSSVGLRRSTEQETTPVKEVPGFTFRQAMLNPAFWLLTSSQAIAALGTSSAELFLVPHLEETGISVTAAGFTLTAVGILGLLTTLALGWLSDYLERRFLIALTYLFQGGGLVLLAFVSSNWVLLPLALLLGAGARASYAVVPLLQAEYFGLENFGKIQGVLYSVFTAGSAIGPVIGAIVRDARGSYTEVFILYACGCLAAILAVALVRRPLPKAGARPISIT